MTSQVHNFTFWLIFGLSLNLVLGEKLIQIPKSEMTHWMLPMPWSTLLKVSHPGNLELPVQAIISRSRYHKATRLPWPYLVGPIVFRDNAIYWLKITTALRDNGWEYYLRCSFHNWPDPCPCLSGEKSLLFTQGSGSGAHHHSSMCRFIFFRSVLNSDWDQRSAKKWSLFFSFGISESLGNLLKPNFGLSDRWIQN